MARELEGKSMRRMTIAFGISVLCAGVAAAQGSSPIVEPHAAHAATDLDHNGQVDHAEFQHRITDVFYFADKDKDGFVKPGELKVFDETRLFETADKNGDGKLSLNEFVAARWKNFNEADTDESGTLSVDEVVAEFNR
jgi:Ca2+-binding EF-hand superfamily protein